MGRIKVDQPFTLTLDGDPTGDSALDLNTAVTINARLRHMETGPSGDIDITSGFSVLGSPDENKAQVSVGTGVVDKDGPWRGWLRVDFGQGFIPGDADDFMIYEEGVKS